MEAATEEMMEAATEEMMEAAMGLAMWLLTRQVEAPRQAREGGRSPSVLTKARTHHHGSCQEGGSLVQQQLYPTKLITKQGYLVILCMSMYPSKKTVFRETELGIGRAHVRRLMDARLVWITRPSQVLRSQNHCASPHHHVKWEKWVEVNRNVPGQ